MSGLRRLFFALVALWYLASVTGGVGPLVATLGPLARAAVHAHGPGEADEADFPCAHHVCGCTDAAVCRTSCCCFPRVPAAKPCPSCADEVPGPVTPPSGPRAGRVMRCGCPSPVAFHEGRAPEQDRRHAAFVALVAVPAGFVRPSFTGTGVAGFLEPDLKVPISS